MIIEYLVIILGCLFVGFIIGIYIGQEFYKRKLNVKMSFNDKAYQDQSKKIDTIIKNQQEAFDNLSDEERTILLTQQLKTKLPSYGYPHGGK